MSFIGPKRLAASAEAKVGVSSWNTEANTNTAATRGIVHRLCFFTVTITDIYCGTCVINIPAYVGWYI